MKCLKKMITAWIALALAFSIIFIYSDHANAATSGNCGKNLTWSLTSGTLTISGTGDMYDYSSDYTDVPWYDSKSSVSKVVIEEGVTSISGYAFYSCSRLTSVTIPNGVTQIGRSAFEECYKLTSVTVPDSVTSLGKAVFRYCDSLKTATLGNGITSIPEDAFYNCQMLTSANIPYGVTSIGESAFGWTSLSSVEIPYGVVDIGQYAFQRCKMPSVTIPGSVTSIADRAFLDCTLLEGIWVSEENTVYSNDEYGVLFDKQQTTLIMAPGGLSGSYIIPETTTGIAAYAFYGHDGVTSITVPNGVTYVGEYAFYDCTNLVYNTYDNAQYIGNSEFPYMVLITASSTSITSCNILSQTRFVECYAFSGCRNLASVVYCGTELEWNSISIGASNTYLLNASRQYHDLIDGNCTTPPVCSLCGNDVGEASGHSGTWIELVESTCTQDGMKARICDVCGATETVTLPALGHEGEAIVTAPTCTEQGYTVLTCTVCGVTTTSDYVPALGHNDESVITVPTCTEQGYTTNTCTVCGDVTITDYVDAKGHGWSAWIQLSAPSCTAEGSQMRFCNCGTKETEVLDKLSHSYVDGVCTVCDHTMSGHVTLDTEVVLSELSLTEDLYIDLNGYDLSGTIITNGYKIYGMDSTTEEYTCDSMGYFSCVDENGNAIAPESLYTTEDMMRYMTIGTDDGYTFHRFYLGITNVSLAPLVTGFGYKAEFYGDEMVQSMIASVGYNLWLGGGNPISRTTDFKNVVTLRLQNFDVVNYGEPPVNATATITLVDGTTIESATASYSMRQMVEAVNGRYTSLDDSQLSALQDMIENHPIMQSWQVENIFKKPE